MFSLFKIVRENNFFTLSHYLPLFRPSRTLFLYHTHTHTHSGGCAGTNQSVLSLVPTQPTTRFFNSLAVAFFFSYRFLLVRQSSAVCCCCCFSNYRLLARCSAVLDLPCDRSLFAQKTRRRTRKHASARGLTGEAHGRAHSHNCHQPPGGLNTGKTR